MRGLHCSKCNSLLKEEFDYCPYCGNKYDHYRISHKIGDKGPAGGIIFFDKGSRSSGWQYLEAAPNDITHVFGSTGNLNISTSKEIGETVYLFIYKEVNFISAILTILSNKKYASCRRLLLQSIYSLLASKQSRTCMLHSRLLVTELGMYMLAGQSQSTEIAYKHEVCRLT